MLDELAGSSVQDRDELLTVILVLRAHRVASEHRKCIRCIHFEEAQKACTKRNATVIALAKPTPLSNQDRVTSMEKKVEIRLRLGVERCKTAAPSGARIHLHLTHLRPLHLHVLRGYPTSHIYTNSNMPSKTTSIETPASENG